MTWLQRHRFRSFVRSSVWIVPVAGLLLALALAPVLRHLDATTGWRLLAFSPSGARSLLAALVASGLSFIVFTFSILLVAVQIASANLSPRVIPYGAGSIQVPRRLHAMLENLLEVLPAHRAPALREHLSLIQRSVHRGFQDHEDQVRAETRDTQGVGGAR